MPDLTVTDYPLDISGKPIGLREIASTQWVPTHIDVFPYLGYTDTLKRHVASPGQTLVLATNPNAYRVHWLVAWLLYYDNVIAISTEDSVATVVGDLQVDFKRQLALIYRRCGEIVEELARMVDVPVRYNKYKGSSGSTYSLRCPV